jgi:hypothetical protein
LYNTSNSEMLAGIFSFGVSQYAKKVYLRVNHGFGIFERNINALVDNNYKRSA